MAKAKRMREMSITELEAIEAEAIEAEAIEAEAIEAEPEKSPLEQAIENERERMRSTYATLHIEIKSADGKIIDTIRSTGYFRDFNFNRDKDGHEYQNCGYTIAGVKGKLCKLLAANVTIPKLKVTL